MSISGRIQTRLLFTMAKFINIPIPETYSGAGAREKAGAWCAARGMKEALIITDKTVMELGIADLMLKSLNEEGIGYTIYDGVLPNPTVGLAEEAVRIGRARQVDVVIAVGGGSPIDCAKLVAAALPSRRKVKSLVGFSRVWKTPLPLVAIPTTAGTGSEVTVGAVISDDVTHVKSIMLSPKIVPGLAILDGETMVKLPPRWTAMTAFDALTHAVEAYIGRYFNAGAGEQARDAVALINKYLERAFADGNDLEARDALAQASYKAGMAMNKCSVGYAHAFGHRLTGFYDLPHGLAVGMFLPHVLEFDIPVAEKRLARLAVACGLGSDSESVSVLARKFVDRIFELYKNIELPETCDNLKRSDYPLIIREAFREANATYAVPKYMNRGEAASLLDKINPDIS
ncbi:MAG: iron-containing alcohol dehydrogenase [Desulfosudaceae bacterium]